MKLNVLQFVCPVGFYGAERWILALASHLDPERIVCHLAVTEESSSQDLQIVDRYPSAIGKTFKLPMRGAFDPSIIFSLVSLLRREDIHIIHTHGYKSDLLGGIAARLCGVSTVGTPHGFGACYNWKSRLYRRVGLDSLRFFDAVAPLSPDLSREVEEHGIHPEKISTIVNGVDLEEITRLRSVETTIESVSGLPGGRKIGYIGQIIERKKLGHLISAFNIAWDMDKSLQLVVVGDGDKRLEMENFAHSLPAAPAIHFLGFREDRLEILRQLDLFAMTSESEGIPRCLMEAMGMGIPVVAFETPGVDVLIQQGLSGTMVPYGNTAALADEFLALTADRSRAESLAKCARFRVETDFSAARMAKEYMDLFERISSVDR